MSLNLYQWLSLYKKRWLEIVTQTIFLRTKLVKHSGKILNKYPFTLVRIVVRDEYGQPRFTHPLWVLVISHPRLELSLEQIFQVYSQRSDLEHFFHFGNQKLLMADYQTPDLEREERWWLRGVHPIHTPTPASKSDASFIASAIRSSNHSTACSKISSNGEGRSPSKAKNVLS